MKPRRPVAALSEALVEYHLYGCPATSFVAEVMDPGYPGCTMIQTGRCNCSDERADAIRRGLRGAR